MPRTALSVAAGVVALLVVSVGLCQTLPKPVPTTNAPVPLFPQPTGPTYTPPFPIAPPEVGSTTSVPSPPVASGLKASGPSAPGQPPVAPRPVVPPGEKMTVKVYSVPDLIATIQPPPAQPSPFAAHPEIAAAMQQVQLQVQMAAHAAQANDPNVPDELTKKLERLKKALRVAAPRQTWTEEGGEGEIEVYPEGMCLIVRQTASGHEAISDLLTQLRATQNIQIELSIEMMSLEGVPDDKSAELIKMLNREMSADELAQFRKCGAKIMLSSVTRMANGRTASSGLCPELPLRFTAVTGSDHSAVDFRTELAFPIGVDDADEMAVMSQALSQSRTVSVGKSLAFMFGPGGDGAVVLVTPKVIDRSAGASK